MPTLATCPGCGADLFVREESTVVCDFCHNRYFALSDGDGVRLEPVELASGAPIPTTGARASTAEVSRGAAVFNVPAKAGRALAGEPVALQPANRATSRNQLIAGIVLVLTVCVGAYCVVSLLVGSFLTP